MYRLTVDCTTMNYYFQKLKCSERLADVACEIRKNHNVWGSFKGLFGLAGDELITITQAQVTDSTTFNVVESQVWQPTARPTTSTPLSKEGLYVFRQFVTQPEHLPAMVELSTEAWLTFESAENFRAQPWGCSNPLIFNKMQKLMETSRSHCLLGMTVSAPGKLLGHRIHTHRKISTNATN
jgi:hypothetical protein